MAAHPHEKRPPPHPDITVPVGARFSSASAGLLIAAAAATLATVYGARETAADGTAVEVVLGAAVAAIVVGVVPVAVALARKHAGLVVFTLALLSAGAAAIHYAVIRAHFDEYWAYGLFFVGMGLFQLFWATAVVLRPTRILLALGGAGNVAIVAAWIVTRTVGLLLGPAADEVEPIGLADALATGFELAIVAGAMVLLLRPDASVRTRPTRAEAFTWALWLLVAVGTTIGLLSAVGAASGVLPPSA